MIITIKTDSKTKEALVQLDIDKKI